MKSSDGGYSADKPFSVLCSGCKHLQLWESHSLKYQCVCGVMANDCAARSGNSGYKVHTQDSCACFEPGTPVSENASINSPSNEAILDRRPMPGLSKLLITGLILSAVYAAAILVYGKIKTNLVINTPLILTLLSGIPIGAVAFTLLRLLKNVVNKGVTKFGQKAGGNLLGWIVSTLLPWVSPVIVYSVMAAFVFHTKLF
jgi:hypothetical protein